MIIGWILYAILGGLFHCAGITIHMWQYWAIVLNVVAIDVWADIQATRKKGD